MIGNIPNGWQLKDFLEVFKDDTAKKKKIPTNDYLDSGNIPIIDQGQKAISGYTNDIEALNTYQPIVIFGDHTRALKYIDFNFSIGADGVKVLKNIENNSNTKYLYYALLNNPIPNTGYNRHFKYLKRIQIPIPPLPQQEKIVKVLDISSQLIEKQKELIKKYDLFLKSKFIEMFGDPIKNPMGWEIVKVDTVCKEIVDCINRTAPLAESETEYKMIRTTNVRKHKIVFNETRYVEEDIYNKWVRRLIPKKYDVVFTREAPVGEAGVITTDEKLFLGQRTMLFRPNENKLNSFYLLYELMGSSINAQIEKISSGSTVKHLSVPHCKKFNINLPNITLQNKFATIVEKIEKIIEQENKKLEHLETLHKSLMDKAFKGEIV